MLAVPVDRLPAARSCRGGCAYEPKWDGWRVLVFREAGEVYLQSRTGRPLAAYFPDVVRLARAGLPPGAVVDGELLVWASDRGRTSFVALQRRITAGANAVRAARAHPAHLVAFDLLQAPGGAELLARPLRERRARLADLLADAPPPLTLCPQTTDAAEAAEWFETWPAAGVEGLVVKGLATPYRPGTRGWQKVRHKHSTEAVVGGVTGTLSDPETVLVGRFDADGRLRYAGRTHALQPRQRRELAAHLAPAPSRRTGGVDHPWPRPLPAAWSGQLERSAPLEYVQVEIALAVEISVDAAFEHDRWRHRPAFVRVRPDVSTYDVPLTGVADPDG